jgi:hypothetical protein
MAHIDKSGHLHLDSPMGITTMVLCPVTGHVEDIIIHQGDTTPAEPICEGCYEVFNYETEEDQQLDKD